MKCLRVVILLLMATCIFFVVFFQDNLQAVGILVSDVVGVLLILNMVDILMGYFAKLPIGLGIGPKLDSSDKNYTARFVICSLSVVLGVVGIYLIINGVMP